MKDCFKFKVGNAELDEAKDYDGKFEIKADVNYVAGGSVCYVKKVTFYRHVDGAVVDCGTVSVNSTIEFQKPDAQ